MTDIVAKKCCGLCPYSRENTLFLHPERAEAFAISATNPYNDFVCHKTGVSVELFEGGSEIVRGEKSVTCHGFAVLQDNENKCVMENTDPTAFNDYFEMIEHHTDEYERQNAKRNG